MKKNNLLFILNLFLIVWCMASCTKQGPQGIPGNPGDPGAAGAIGPAGKDGSTFLSGKGIPDKKTGETGDYYLDEENGDLYGPKTSEGWDKPFSFGGQKGGIILSGSDAPDSATGIAGDFYLDTVNYTIYGPKAVNGHWNIGILLHATGGSSGVTAYLISNPYDYMTGSSLAGFYLNIGYDNDNKFNLWKAVNEQQDLLAIYLKQRLPVYSRKYDNSQDSIVGYENLISSADGMVPAVTNNTNASDGGIEVSYRTDQDGLIVNFYGEEDRCDCSGSHLLSALKNDLGLQAIMVFVISPSAISHITPILPKPPKIDVRDPYTNQKIRELIKPYLY